MLIALSLIIVKLFITFSSYICKFYQDIGDNNIYG